MESDTMQNTFRNVRQAQHDEDGLLTDVVSIFEQMKVLNHSRGAGLEALAQRHEEEIERINKRHEEELEKKDREHREELQSLRECHERSPLSGQFDDSIRNVKFALDFAHKTQMNLIGLLQATQERRKSADETIISLCSKLLLESSTLLEKGIQRRATRPDTSSPAHIQVLKDLAKGGLDLTKTQIEDTKWLRDVQLRRNEFDLKRTMQTLIDLAAAANIDLGLSLDHLLGTDAKEE